MWRTEPAVALQTRLLEAVPRVRADRDIVWVDIRGLPFFKTVDRIRDIVAGTDNARIQMGVADTPVAAEVAARYSQQLLTYVEKGKDAAFLSSFPVTVLHPDTVTENLMLGAGVESCGELASITQESVEVRFGAFGVEMWRLARAKDKRRIFTALPVSMPSATFEWTEYTVRRTERLVFIVNALCGNVCATLQERGSGALSLDLIFSLADRTTHSQTVRSARPTTSRTVWMRLLRLAIEKVKLSDGVVGLSLTVSSLGGLGDRQGDLFDSGFSTGRSAEEALGQVLEDQGDVVMMPENSSHPLLDRRTVWNSLTAVQASDSKAGIADPVVSSPLMTLQLLPDPAHISVITECYQGDQVPRAYWDHSRQHIIVDAAGPDVVEGDTWGNEYSREYFRCVNDSGTLVWLFRDAKEDTWYLHGWWD